MVKIIFLNIKTTYFRLFEWLRVVFSYYIREPKFAWIDLLFAGHYFFKNPHRISRDFLKKQGARNIYAFGETPLTTLDHIAKECGILSKDSVFELGSGSGRTCFWLKTFINCRVVGVDYLPRFINTANRIKKLTRLTHIDFYESDMLHIDLRKATVIYLYGTCLEETFIHKLIQRFTILPSGTKIITVSYPLTDYSPNFALKKEFPAHFPWGKASIFLNEKL